VEEQRKIPTSKVQRAARFLKTGGVIGANYVKHYTKKAFNADVSDKDLHELNAKELLGALGELKGSALKVAQMLSMDQNILPTEYVDQLMRAQHKAPALSYPLIAKTFKTDLRKTPEELFDTFDKHAVNAASIGQVHLATLKKKKLAVKIQYPGVAESITSDLKMVKSLILPFVKMKEEDVAEFYSEIESKLLEETDYPNELQQSQEIAKACEKIDGLVFPKFYPELSGKKVLTMDWLDGWHLDEYLATNPSQEERNRYGQIIWNFYDYQTHVLKLIHADPHPGNFLFMADGKLGILDFGCVKRIPPEAYRPLVMLFDKKILKQPEKILEVMNLLNVIQPNDTKKEIEFYTDIFNRGLRLLGRPVHQDEFDFGDKSYITEIFTEGMRIKQMKEVRQSKVARGTRHGLYINRAYFGVYMLLHKLGAKIKTKSAYLKADAA